MKDRPQHERRGWLLEPSQPFPADAERAAAWQAEFARARGAFRGAFEHAAIGMAIVDLDGRFLKVNRSFCQIVGYSEQELQATDFQSITHPDDLNSDLALARRLVAGEIDHFHMEKRYFHKAGHVIWILLSGSVVRDEAGQPYYAIAQIQDISARKAAELESARRLREMERLTRTVSEILHVLETTPGDAAYCAVLRIVVDSFQSKAGLLLRLADDGALVGPYASSPTQIEEVRCLPGVRRELWDAALSKGVTVIENSPRQTPCGRPVSRSLIAPIRHHGETVGLMHIADADSDYDEDDRDLLSRITEIVAPVVHARKELERLTPREMEVMDLVVAGKTQKEIALELGISVQTIAKHRAKVLEKLHVGNDVELVRMAMRMRATPA